MNLKNDREVEIANLLDAGQPYAYIEAKLDVYPSLVSRVAYKMKLIRLTTSIVVGGWGPLLKEDAHNFEKMKEEAERANEEVKRSMKKIQNFRDSYPHFSN